MTPSVVEGPLPGDVLALAVPAASPPVWHVVLLSGGTL